MPLLERNGSTSGNEVNSGAMAANYTIAQRPQKLAI